MPRKQFDIDLFTPEAIADPYPMYDKIRATGDVVWNGLLQAWMVVGYDRVAEVLTDDGERFAELNSDPEFIFWFDAPNMITVDGPYHRRLRGALYPLFTRGAVAKWEARIREVVDELLVPLVEGAASFDLIADFTKLPTIIVAEMLGVPEERHGDFRRWSHEIVSNLSYGGEDAGRVAVMKCAAVEINDYFREEIERHRRERPDDLLTHMLDLSGEARMTDEEIRSTAVLLLLAGYDTTAKTMGNTLIALEANLDQRALVAGDPALVPAAIEEALRWLGPVQYVPRTATSDTQLDGADIAAGDTLFVFLAAANRDAGRWPDPQRFDVKRTSKSNVAFGYGPHLCLGAPLARLEVKVAIERLLAVAPDYHLRDVDLGNSFFVRGPDAGVVEVGATPSAR
jgi:cytochrome P450